MEISKDDAVALFVALGVNTAPKWSDKRLADKLAQVNELVDADTVVDESIASTLTSVLSAIENEEAIVLAGVDAGKATKKASDGKAAKKADAEGKATKKASDGKAAKKADAEGKAPDLPSTPGVRNSMTRPYLAGLVIKKYTREAGVTDAMVAEVDAMYGKENPSESMFCLRNAWHAIRGYMDSVSE